MKKSTTALLATGLLLVSNAALATVINFDDNAPTGGVTGFGTNGSYAESGFTLTVTGNTQLWTIDTTFVPTRPSQNNTDFGFFQDGTLSISLIAASAFSLQSFHAANLDFLPAGSLTLTGYVSGGAILSAVFSTLGTSQ